MKIALLILLVCIVLTVAYSGIRLMHTIKISKGLIDAIVPFGRISDTEGLSVLVLGDSTAVGVGAGRSEESIAGRAASELNATYVENHGVSGATVKDLSGEIEKVERESYDVIIVQIGANDITRFHSPTKTARELADTLSMLPASPKIIIMSAGDVGAATAIPFLLRPFYTALTLRYHAAFGKILTAAGYTYVNLYEAPRGHLFKEEPDVYLAADGFHPSSAGYDIWFEALAPVLK